MHIHVVVAESLFFDSFSSSRFYRYMCLRKRIRVGRWHGFGATYGEQGIPTFEECLNRETPSYSQSVNPSIPSVTTKIRSPRGMVAISVFLIFGAFVSTLAGTTLVWQGTALGLMWALNPRAYDQLAPYGRTIGIPFLLLGFALALSGVGWLKRRSWGWRLTVILIVTQVLVNFVTALMGGVTKGMVGAFISGALLVYLLRPKVKAAFAPKSQSIEIKAQF